MNLEGKRIGFVMTGSFCTFRKTIDELKKIVKLGAKVVPIMSENSYTMDTKFGKAEDFIAEIEEITKSNENSMIKRYIDGSDVAYLEIRSLQCAYKSSQGYNYALLGLDLIAWPYPL